MSESNSIFRHLKVLTSKKRRGRRKVFIYPLREWVVCLLISIFAAIGLIGHAAFDFHTQLNENSVPEVTGERIPRYRPEEAELILRFYEGREKTFEAHRANAPVPAPVEIVIPEAVGGEEEAMGL